MPAAPWSLSRGLSVLSPVTPEAPTLRAWALHNGHRIFLGLYRLIGRGFVSCLILTIRRGALTTITCVQCDPVDACHDINTLNVQTPLPPPKTTGVCGFTI